ncbi:hypothetical protein [Aeoliella sp.]|uniref:hypothetical protein n=1 Tax=Aeoliella sp. TaxID=2795800 RepID=UPI003CCBD469
MIVDIEGGTVGFSFSANSGSTVHVRGGNIGNSFDAHTGSMVYVSGGTLGSLDATSGSRVDINEGTVASINARFGSTVSISGGATDLVRAYGGSSLQMSGGRVRSDFDAEINSNVELVGGEFQLNGEPFADSVITLAAGDVFTGTFMDGASFLFSDVTPFISDTNYSDMLQSATLTRVPLPAIDTSPIFIDGSTATNVHRLRAGQTLSLHDGGMLDRNFTAVDANMNFEGGTVGTRLEIAGTIVSVHNGTIGDRFFASARSVVNMTNGAIGDHFAANSGSLVNLNGGTVGNYMRADSDSTINIRDATVGIYAEANFGSTVNIDGGSVGSGFRASEGSTVNVGGGTVGNSFSAFGAVNILGGTVLSSFTAYIGSEVNIGGGSVGRSFEARYGSTVNITGGTFGDDFKALSGSDINITGTEFYLDGTKVDLEFGVPMVVADRNVRLSGRLADGNDFEFDLFASNSLVDDFFSPDATLTLTLVPEPTSVLLYALALVAGYVRWRGSIRCSSVA